MLRSIHPGIKICAAFILFVIIVIVGHEMIEAKIFDAIANQSGAKIHIGSRSGNLLTGYTFRSFSVTQKAGGPDTPNQMFNTDRLVVRWSINPFQLTEISWNAGSYLINPDGEDPKEIPIGAATMMADGTGWLVQESPVKIGEDDWDGEMEMKIRVDVKEIEGTINIEKLPGEFINVMGNVPDGFTVPRYAVVELNLSGSLESVRVTGSVVDPTTRRSFRF